jgi:hypothetical protein
MSDKQHREKENTTMADPRYSGIVPESSKSFAEKVCRAGWPEGTEPDLERPTAVGRLHEDGYTVDVTQYRLNIGGNLLPNTPDNRIREFFVTERWCMACDIQVDGDGNALHEVAYLLPSDLIDVLLEMYKDKQPKANHGSLGIALDATDADGNTVKLRLPRMHVCHL